MSTWSSSSPRTTLSSHPQYDFETGVINPLIVPGWDNECRFLKEQLQFNDLHLLPIYENMDEGKSLFWMKEIARLNRNKRERYLQLIQRGKVTPPLYSYDFVMKIDADSYLHLPNFFNTLRSFRQQHKREVYYGLYYHMPHVNPPTVAPSQMTFYHSGMGYVLSDDLVEYFGTDEAGSVVTEATGIVDNLEGVPHRAAGHNNQGVGTEDQLWGIWLSERGRRLGRDKNKEWSHGSADSEEAYRLYHALVLNFINAAPNFYYHPQWTHYWALTQFHANTEIIHWNHNKAWYKQIISHFMCASPVYFNWNEKNRWWIDSIRRRRDISYHFHENGTVLPSCRVNACLP